MSAIGSPAPNVADDGGKVDELIIAARRFFSDPSARVDPAPLYRGLLQHASVLDLGPIWLVSGFDEIAWLSRRRELRSFAAVGGQVLPLSQIPSLAKWFLDMLPMRDGEDHRRLKRLAESTFSPHGVANADGVIRRCVDSLLDRAVTNGNVDIVADLAQPLPLAISTAMLDIPVADRAQVQEWALLVQRQFLRYGQDIEEVARVEAELYNFTAFLQSICAARRKRPGDDLLSSLVRAADDGLLTHDELVAFILLLFVNGLETLTAAITMSIWELLQNPGERAAVASDRAYGEAFFNEAIRFHSPVRFTARTLRGEVAVGRHRLHEGDVVAFFYAAANRDPSRFEDPDRFNPLREPGRHIGFGQGPHHCIGESLAVAAGGYVLQRIAQLGDRLVTDVTRETMAWSPALALAKVESLPVRIDFSA